MVNDKLKNVFSRPEYWLMLAFILFTGAKFWEPGIGLSSATYGAIAKNIVRYNNWFSPALSSEIYNPFVEHPYLVLWLDALVFKIFGISPQTIRLVSTVLGILGVLSLFKISQKLFNERVAFLACVFLLFINIYMNYFNSGWLDMSMVGLTLIAFAFAVYDKYSWSGLFVGLAVLAKGFAALTVIPLGIYVIIRCYQQKKELLKFFTAALLPIIIFTVAHYYSEGFIFWQAYFVRQVLVQNELKEQLSSVKDLFWYVLAAMKHSHILFFLAIAGLVKLYKQKTYLVFAVTLGIFIIHILAYSQSSRHYGQYLLPVFPWIAVLAAFFVNQYKFKNFDVTGASRKLFYLAALYFVVIGVLPIQVHSGTGESVKFFQNDLQRMDKIKDIYFSSTPDDQGQWEDRGSYISWYLDKEPRMIDPSTVIKFVTEMKPTQALLLEVNNEFAAQIPEEQICSRNNNFYLISHSANCKK